MYPDVPFVDRKEETSHLQQVLCHPENRMHVICGRTGVGKSKLATQFVHDCKNKGHPVLHYKMKNPRNEKVFLQRLLAEWFEEHPESTVAKIREYLLSPDAVGDLLSIIRQVVPDPSSGLAIESLQKAITSVGGAEVDFPDPVQLVVDVMKNSGTCDSPAVVVVDQYDADVQGRETGMEATFRDISSSLDDSVIWYLTSNNEIRGDGIDCFQLEPFDQKIALNPGATYSSDRGVNEDNSEFSEHNFEATRELVEEANLEYEDSDLIDLHDRTNGVPLLIASICSEPDTMSLRKELNDKPTSYLKFKNDIRSDFVRDLSDQERQLLTKTSIMPILTRDVCSKQTGIGEMRIMQLLDDLCKDGKLMQVQTEYPNGHSYRCHDFYREFLIKCASLNERELRQEAAVNCLRLAFEYYTTEPRAERNSLTDIQLNRFNYQVFYISQNKPFSEIGKIVTSGVDHSETDILEFLSSYHEVESRDYDLGEYLRHVV